VTSANGVNTTVNTDPNKIKGFRNLLKAPLHWTWVNIDPDENAVAGP
jgi:hypothetical protein